MPFLRNSSTPTVTSLLSSRQLSCASSYTSSVVYLRSPRLAMGRTLHAGGGEGGRLMPKECRHTGPLTPFGQFVPTIPPLPPPTGVGIGRFPPGGGRLGWGKKCRDVTPPRPLPRQGGGDMFGEPCRNMLTSVSSPSRERPGEHFRVRCCRTLRGKALQELYRGVGGAIRLQCGC